MAPDPRVDFFVAGVQKAGTTALDHFLRQYPSIQMASVKEVHFFDDDDRDWRRPDYSALLDHFNWSQRDVVRGESTPIYTYWPHAIERLSRYNPAAKILVLLRHPTWRAFSAWRMEVSRHNEPLDFSEAIRGGRSRVRDSTHGAHRVFSYVERGFYGEQAERVLASFPRSNVLYARSDHLRTRHSQTLSSIERFLGIAPAFRPDAGIARPVANVAVGGLDEIDRNFLDELFRPHIEQAQALTGLDLSDWLSDEYAEPEAPPAP